MVDRGWKKEDVKIRRQKVAGNANVLTRLETCGGPDGS
jgi:hypothetical protein